MSNRTTTGTLPPDDDDDKCDLTEAEMDRMTDDSLARIAAELAGEDEEED
jgi:hypothetical protein